MAFPTMFSMCRKVCSVCSRDPAVWKDMDVLIDVGGEYDPATCRYDHHQRGFEEVFGHGFVTKLSSAGLVYKHYGLCLLYTSPSPRDRQKSRMPSSA